VRPRFLTALLLVAAAAPAAGCGSDNEPKPSIPASFTQQFEQRLTSVENRFNFGGGACNDIPKDQRLVNSEISRLPSSVDSDVRNALQDSFDHLFDLTSSQCDDKKGRETDTTTETTQTQTQSTETQTETSTTQTAPTDTTPTDTGPTDTTPTPPPDDGGGGGDEQGGGGAQGPGL
jgi:cation transport regulator ChaB